MEYGSAALSIGSVTYPTRAGPAWSARTPEYGKDRRKGRGKMAEVTVEVEEDATGENTGDEVTPGTAHAEEVLIDAGIVSGVAAVRAEERADNAAVSEVASEIAASRAESAAEAVHSENTELRAVTADLLETARLLAGVQAAQAASEVHSDTLGDPGQVDPSVDVEPENTHFLNRKWNLFGKKDTS